MVKSKTNPGRFSLIVILVLIPEIFFTSTFGQGVTTCDSVFIAKGYLVTFSDSTLRFANDTSICLPNNIDYKVRKDKEYRSAAFYENIKDKSDKNLLVKELYDAMIREQQDTLKLPEGQKTANYHPEYAGKTIGRIDIMPVDIIEGDVNDLSAYARSGYSAVLNKLHKDTRQTIVKKNLTFKEGDVLGAYTISDNEYYLRSLRYIEDTKIYVLTDSLKPEIANILVVVKDVFPFNFGIGIGGLTDYTLGINDVNILGSGHEFSNSFRYDASKNPALGYKGELSFKNLWGSFLDASLQYRNNALEELYKMTAKREFITPETKYGGGIELFQQKTSIQVIINDSASITIPFTKNYFDQWFGRAFLLNSIDRKSLVLKARYMTTRYSQRPLVEADTNQQFYDVNLLMGSVTLLKQNHYKEHMLLGYGITEDIDYGYAIELSYGYQFSEFFKAPYIGISLKAADKFNMGYIGGGIEYGGHINHGYLAQGLLRAGFTYYSPLFKAKLFHYRFLMKFNYTEGIRLYPYEVLDLRKEIRGLSASGIEGEKRLVARFELVTFLKGNLIGFRFSPNLFYDAGFLNAGTRLLSSKSFYSFLGMGVRIRNENLAFQTIIIRLGYYTGNPVKSGQWGAGLSTSTPDVIRDYDIVKPDLLRY